MTLIIQGSGFTIEHVVDVARNNKQVALHPEALERIKKCRAMLEKKIDAHEIMCGVNSGIGEFSEVVLNNDQVKDFQKYLIYNHAAGITHELVRRHVDFLETDRPLYNDHNAMKALIKSCQVLQEVEATFGSLA